MPLELSIEDARGVTVRREPLRCPMQALRKFAIRRWKLLATGTWNVNVHIVKDGQVGGLLGSVAVRVQEFLPDRLKISTRLSKESLEGGVSRRTEGACAPEPVWNTGGKSSGQGDADAVSDAAKL